MRRLSIVNENSEQPFPHFYTHLIKAKNDRKGCLIGNNHGHMNGWTKQVYGKVLEVL